MKINIAFTIILAAAATSAGGATISEVLARIETNNPELKAASAANAAAEAEMRADNTLPPTSVEYSPFFRSGVSGVASSELIVSQEFDFPTLYASRSRQAALERRAADGTIASRRQELLLQARTAMLDLIRLRREEGILSSRLTDTESLLSLYEKSLELGQATQLDVNKTRLETQSISREILQNAAEQASLEQTLVALNGNRPLELSDLSYDSETSQLSIPDGHTRLAGPARPHRAGRGHAGILRGPAPDGDNRGAAVVRSRIGKAFRRTGREFLSPPPFVLINRSANDFTDGSLKLKIGCDIVK